MIHIPRTIRLSTSALVVIDMQEEYFADDVLRQQRTRLVAACNTLIDAFHGAGRPVLFIRTAHTETSDTWTLNMRDDKQGVLFDGTSGVELLHELHRDTSDRVVTKMRDSAFHATIMEQTLRELHIDTLILAGVSTQNCVGQTAAGAYARNLRVVLAEDAIGTHDITYHEPTLAMLAKEYRQVRAQVADIVDWITASGSASGTTR